MTSETKEVYVRLQLPGSLETVTVGRYWQERTARHQHFGVFAYEPQYLKRADAVPLEPFELPLQPREVRTSRLQYHFGCLRDALPDTYGQHIHRRFMRGYDLRYDKRLLYGPDDAAGAITFGLQETPPVAALQFNQVADLPVLLRVISSLHDEEQYDNWGKIIQSLPAPLTPCTRLGGARPKLTVEDDSGLWIAKLPAYRTGWRADQWNDARVEASMLALAAKCGLHACDYRLSTVEGTDVLLVRRFDRHKTQKGYVRHRFVSALTVLGADETDQHRELWDYQLLADEVRRRSESPRADVLELYKRMVFNALISNTDDHIRNHGLLARGANWRLSPAYDLTPNPYGEFSAMSIGEYGGLFCRKNLLSSCHHFQLPQHEAAGLIDEMYDTVASHWRGVLQEHAVCEKDISCIATAFCPPGFGHAST